MAGNQSFERFFESVNLTSDAIATAVLDQNERQYRLGQALLLEMQRVQHENIELAKRFAQNPADVGGMYRLFVETMSKRQGRALEVGREVLATLAESTSEARDTARKLISMQRAATEAATETASRAVNSAVETVRETAAPVAAAANTLGAAAERVAGDTVLQAQATAEGIARTASVASAAGLAAPEGEVMRESAAAQSNGRSAGSARKARDARSARTKGSRRARGSSQSTRGRAPRRPRTRPESRPAAVQQSSQER